MSGRDVVRATQHRGDGTQGVDFGVTVGQDGGKVLEPDSEAGEGEEERQGERFKEVQYL